MLICASCGQSNPPEARFCFACGVVLDQVAPGRDLRKTVTVLFAVTMMPSIGSSIRGIDANGTRPW